MRSELHCTASLCLWDQCGLQQRHTWSKMMEIRGFAWHKAGWGDDTIWLDLFIASCACTVKDRPAYAPSSIRVSSNPPGLGCKKALAERAGWREANNSLGSWSLGWEPHSIVFLLSFTQKKRKASEKFEHPLVFMFSGMERRNELSSPFRVDFRLALLRQFRSPKIHTWITIYTTIIYMRL